MWALVGSELHCVRLNVPRIFYVNQRKPREETENTAWTKCNRILPRSRPVFNLYQFKISERLFVENSEWVNKVLNGNDIYEIWNYIGVSFGSELLVDLSSPDIEGIYETNVKPEHRALIQLGCICSVVKSEARKLIAAGIHDFNSFSLNQLEMRTLPYLKQVGFQTVINFSVFLSLISICDSAGCLEMYIPLLSSFHK